MQCIVGSRDHCEFLPEASDSSLHRPNGLSLAIEMCKGDCERISQAMNEDERVFVRQYREICLYILCQFGDQAV